MKYSCCKSVVDDSTDGVKCTRCDNYYHYQCLYPAAKKVNIKKCWTCPECSLSQPRQVNKDNTPVRSRNLNAKQSSEDNIKTREGAAGLESFTPDNKFDLLNSSSFLEHVRSIISSELNSLKSDLQVTIIPIQNELKAIKEEFLSLKHSLEFINNKFDDFNKRIDNCEINIKEFSNKCSEIGNLKTSLDVIESENRSREQWARRSNVEIYGIPEQKGENLFSILQSIANKTEFKLNIESDIDFVTRVAAKSDLIKRSKPIIVRFLCRWKKDEFLAQVRKLKLKCSDIGYTSKNNFIYFNDHLTSYNKSLLLSAKKIAREKNFSYVWVKNCAIMIRRNESSPVIHISKNSDLKKIV